MSKFAKKLRKTVRKCPICEFIKRKTGNKFPKTDLTLANDLACLASLLRFLNRKLNLCEKVVCLTEKVKPGSKMVKAKVKMVMLEN